MPSLNVTGDNLPKDSGNRYVWAPFDPSGSAFKLPFAYPFSGDMGGLAIGHVTNTIADIMTSTGAISSGVDIGGYTHIGLYMPPMGSAGQVTFQVSASGIAWTNLSTTTQNAALSATAALATGYFVGNGSALDMVRPFRYVRLSASTPQTANRTALWVLAS